MHGSTKQENLGWQVIKGTADGVARGAALSALFMGMPLYFLGSQMGRAFVGVVETASRLLGGLTERAQPAE